MGRKWLLIFTILLMLMVGGCTEETVSAEKGERIFGNFVTIDLAGDPVDEQVLRGHKLTMVNIWATFCSPCVEEMPALAQLQAQYGDDLQVIGILWDGADKNGNILPDKKATAAAIIEQTGANYRHLLPSQSLDKAYLSRVEAVPVTIFVDQEGYRIGAEYPGAKSKAQWEQIVESLLESLE